MSQEQQQYAPDDDEPSSSGGPAQQQQQPQPEPGHAGQGADSVMKQLREWEKRRSADSGGKRRHGPN